MVDSNPIILFAEAVPPAALFLVFLFVILWGLLWKGLGLWRAAKNGQRKWFVAMLVFNTLGVLPILYLKFLQRR